MLERWFSDRLAALDCQSELQLASISGSSTFKSEN